MANRFVLNETSYHGKGAISAIADEIKARGFKKAFVCSDPDLIKFGVTKKVTDILDGADIAYEIYSNIKPNPTIENVQTGVEAFKNAGTDCIVAIGGGSSMDCAKAVGARIAYPKKSVGKLKGLLKIRRKIPMLIAIPTTAGTGSEVTLASVITDSEKQHKYTLMDFNLIPNVAILDPMCTVSLPPHANVWVHTVAKTPKYVQSQAE